MGRFNEIINGKCPRCGEGDIFKEKAFKLRSFNKMYEHCPNCNLKYEREPGFFIGAMYINYAFSVAIIVAVGIALNVFGYYSLYSFIFGVLGVVVFLLPFLFRFSRILYLHWFGGVSYDPQYKKQS